MGLLDVNKKTISALNSIPFESIIGGPLNACIKAQEQAACSTAEFIERVGLEVNPETGEKKAVYVVFSYIQGGKRVNISVPLLTIVPIPYIGIQTIDIAFKAAISGVETTHDETTVSVENNQTLKSTSKKGLGILRKKTTSEMTATISSKKDSKATRDSSYSIEATIDVNVHGCQESMPTGMAKILELLGNAVDVMSTSGEMSIEGPIYDEESKKYVMDVRYKNPDGLFDPEKITVSGATRETGITSDEFARFTASAGAKITITATADNGQKCEKKITIPA
ncbi:MAG: DUF2589 domain-containing protein [Paludibacteraceae bacterium]|nr:DUF2589 domain-containing protein [Paludibacteraceae bacterium]